MADHYGKQVAFLREVLSDEDRLTETATVIRELVDRIELPPVEEDGEKTLSVNLYGHLAGILNLAAGSKKPASVFEDGLAQIKLVAGARNTLCALFVAMGLGLCGQPCRQLISRAGFGLGALFSVRGLLLPRFRGMSMNWVLREHH